MSGRVLCRSARMRLYHEFESGMVVISRKSTRGHCRNREDRNRTYCLEVGCRFASFQIKKNLGSWLQRSPRTPTHPHGDRCSNETYDPGNIGTQAQEASIIHISGSGEYVASIYYNASRLKNSIAHLYQPSYQKALSPSTTFSIAALPFSYHTPSPSIVLSIATSFPSSSALLSSFQPPLRNDFPLSLDFINVSIALFCSDSSGDNIQNHIPIRYFISLIILKGMKRLTGGTVTLPILKQYSLTARQQTTPPSERG
jgi:hypothetical protein